MKTELTELIEKKEKEFDYMFTRDKLVDGTVRAGYDKFDLAMFNRQTIIALLKKIIEIIKDLQSSTIEETGSYKYDIIYDEIVEKLQKSLDELKDKNENRTKKDD